MKKQGVPIALVWLVSLVGGFAELSKALYPLPEEYIPNRVLIKFYDHALPANWRSTDLKRAHPLFDALGASRVSLIDGIEVFIVEFDHSVDVPGLVGELLDHPDVEFAEPDGIWHTAWTPNDPFYSSQWNLPKIQAPNAWEVWRGDPSFLIAIVDTGVNYTHPDLNDRYNGGYDYWNNDSDPWDDNGHGTAVASVAVAETNNGIGIAAVCPQGGMKAYKVCSSNGSCTWSSVANGVTRATDDGVVSINLSLGGPTGSATIENAVNYAWSQGVVLSAASGGGGSTQINYPAGYEHVIAVAASDRNDNRASFSNYGDWVEVAAPGVEIYTVWGGNYSVLNGTSFATSHVSGQALLLYSKLIANPEARNMTNAQLVRGVIENTADYIGNWVRFGRINLDRAIRSLVIQGDVNGDGCVNDADLNAVLMAYGSTGPNRADLNSDGVVNDSDLNLVLTNYGRGC